MDLDLIDFRKLFLPTEQGLKQLDRHHKLLSIPKLKRLGREFETFEQLMREDVSQRIKECVRSILVRYDDILDSAYQDIEVFKRDNPSKRFEFASTVKLHIVYATTWCRNCLEVNNDIYSQRTQLHNIAKAEAARFLVSVVRQETTRRKSSLPKDSLQINRIYEFLLIVLTLLACVPLGFQEEAPYFFVFASIILFIINKFSVFNEKLSENDRERMIIRSIHKKYNKVYKCNTGQLLNTLGYIQNIS